MLQDAILYMIINAMQRDRQIKIRQLYIYFNCLYLVRFIMLTKIYLLCTVVFSFWSGITVPMPTA